MTLLTALGTMFTALGQGEMGAASLIGLSNGNGSYNYTLNLENTGTSGIGTFWYAWIPGQFYLPTAPLVASAPAGWTASIIEAPASFGYSAWSVQYTANSAAEDLGVGSSLSFSFTSTDSPAALAGNSSQFPSTPIGTSWLYSGSPFSDAGTQIAVTSVSEPSALALLAVGLLGLTAARRWRRMGDATVG